MQHTTQVHTQAIPFLAQIPTHVDPFTPAPALSLFPNDIIRQICLTQIIQRRQLEAYRVSSSIQWLSNISFTIDPQSAPPAAPHITTQAVDRGWMINNTATASLSTNNAEEHCAICRDIRIQQQQQQQQEMERKYREEDQTKEEKGGEEQKSDDNAFPPTIPAYSKSSSLDSVSSTTTTSHAPSPSLLCDDTLLTRLSTQYSPSEVSFHFMHLQHSALLRAQTLPTQSAATAASLALPSPHRSLTTPPTSSLLAPSLPLSLPLPTSIPIISNDMKDVTNAGMLLNNVTASPAHLLAPPSELSSYVPSSPQLKSSTSDTTGTTTTTIPNTLPLPNYKGNSTMLGNVTGMWSSSTMNINNPNNTSDPIYIHSPPSLPTDRDEWESSLINKGLLTGNHVHVGTVANSHNNNRRVGVPIPSFLSSIIPYTESKSTASHTPSQSHTDGVVGILPRSRTNSIPDILEEGGVNIGGMSYDSPIPIPVSINKRTGTSYASLLSSSSNNNNSNDIYDPFLLDDPNIKSGKHRVVMSLPGMISSMMRYVRKKELKYELNLQFKQRHEWLNTSMTLSKLRRCKQLLLDVCVNLDIEISTLCMSYIYFEKLLLSNLITKSNRKLISCICLLLAYKYNEVVREEGEDKGKVQRLLVSLEKILGVPRPHILKQEFTIYAQLYFNLSVKSAHLTSHFKQVLSKLDTVPQEYLDIQWALI